MGLVFLFDQLMQSLALSLRCEDIFGACLESLGLLLNINFEFLDSFHEFGEFLRVSQFSPPQLRYLCSICSQTPSIHLVLLGQLAILPLEDDILLL